MDIREILKKVDHTLLGVTAGWSDIEQILIDAEKFGTASACIPPAFVKRAKDYVEGQSEDMHRYRLPQRL